MTATVITERCGCGARFRVVDGFPSDARLAVREWREDHYCPETETEETADAS